MRKKVSIAIGFLLLALLGGIVWQTLRHREPIHQGKPLSFWLSGFELDDFQGKPSFNESVEAVREAGTNAVPTLLRMLRTSDSDLKQRFKLLLRKQCVVQIHYVRADTQRWAATQGFMALGKLARYAVPQLDEISQQEISR